MKIYTKKGDFGFSSVFGGKKVLKSDIQLTAYGNIDELNSFIGFLITKLKHSEKPFFAGIQKDLLAIASYLSGFNIIKSDLDKKVGVLEKEIDKMELLLPPLNNFVLPGGCENASIFHIIRTITRRVERSVVGYFAQNTIDNTQKKRIIKYLNRLSDYFFIKARFENHRNNIKEEIWNDK